MEWVNKRGRTNIADPPSRAPSLILLGMTFAQNAEGYVQAELSTEQNVLLQELQAGYETDPWFAVAERVAGLRFIVYLHFSDNNRVYVANDSNLKMRIIREAHA